MCAAPQCPEGHHGQPVVGRQREPQQRQAVHRPGQAQQTAPGNLTTPSGHERGVQHGPHTGGRGQDAVFRLAHLKDIVGEYHDEVDDGLAEEGDDPGDQDGPSDAGVIGGVTHRSRRVLEHVGAAFSGGRQPGHPDQRQGQQRGRIRQAVDQKRPPRPANGQHYPAHHGTDRPRGVELGRVQGDGVQQGVPGAPVRSRTPAKPEAGCRSRTRSRRRGRCRPAARPPRRPTWPRTPGRSAPGPRW